MVSCKTVHEYRSGYRMLGILVPTKECSKHTGEHIAAAAFCEPGITGIVDENFPAGCRDQCVRSFQYYIHAIFLCHFPGNLEPVFIHFRWIRIDQTCHFPWMR